MKLKLDEHGHAVLADGKPVYIKDDGKELTFDAKEAFDKISSLNGENAGFRTRYQTAETALKNFDGLNAEDARKALDTLKTVDLKKMVDSGELDKVRGEVSKVFEVQLAEAKAKTDKATKALKDERIGGAFARSKFITEKCTVPADMIQARFGSQIDVGDDGKLIATDAAGNKIFSRRPESAGSPAELDEALEILIDQYPYKANLLKGSNASGGGSQQSGGGSGGKKEISRSDFDKLSPVDQSGKIGAGFAVTA